MSTKQQSSSTLLAALLPVAVIVGGYAGWMVLWPPDSVKEIATLQSQVEQLRAQQISPAQQAAVAAQLADVDKVLTSKRDELGQLREDASRMMSGSLSSIQQIEAERRVNRLFEGFGLRLVSQAPLDDRNVKLLKSLEDATSELSSRLNAITSADAAGNADDDPFAKMAGAVPESVIKQMRQSSSRRAKGPQTQLSELKLVGNYSSMLRGLQEISVCCPQVVVTSVAFETPKVPTADPSPLIWKVRYQLRPAGPVIEAEPHDTDEPVIAAKPITYMAPIVPPAKPPATRHTAMTDNERLPIRVFPASSTRTVDQPVTNSDAEEGN